MKKLKYNITDKYTGIKYNPNGVSKEEGYNCLSMCLDFCKNEFDMPYTFEDKITGDLSWKNITELFKDKPEEVFKELERHFSNYYKMILPHQMRKGDVIIIDNGDIKMPCIYVGGNKILVTRKEKASIRIKDSDDKPISIKDGIKVVSLKGLKIYQVYRIKEEKKITTKAVYDLDTLELIEEESYLYDGDIAECVDPFTIAYLIVAIISLIISIWMYFNIPEPPGDMDIGRVINTRSTKEPLKVVYGLQKVGGNDVFMHTSGDYHRDLYIIQTLSEGECEGIHQVGGVDQISIDDHLPSYFSGLMSYQFYPGNSTQTYDTTVNGVRGDYKDNMRYTSYIRWYFKNDKDKYVLGKPTRLLELEGRKLYDFRDSTAEISWSQNAVLALYDWFTNARYGLDIPSEYIDITSWTSAANYFDDKGWLFNYITSGNKNPWDVGLYIMKHFRASISWFGGVYYLLVADINEESSVMTIEDKHIVQDESGKAILNLSDPNRFSTPKGIKVKFLDKEKSYIEDEVLIGEESGVVKATSYYGYTDRKTTCDLATYELERLRLNRTISGTFRDDCLELAPHDLITFNSTALSIADQPMRVISTSYAGNGLIGLTLHYEAESLYDDDYDVSIEGIYTCTRPNPNVVIQIENPQISEEIFYYRLRTESRLHIKFTVPEGAEGWFKHVEVWQAIISVVDPVDPFPSQADYEHQFNTTNDFNIDHVQQDQKYYIKLISVSIFDVKDTFDNAPLLSWKIVGNSDAPQSLSYLAAIPSNNSLTLFSDKLDDPDIEIYEFRMALQDGEGTWNTSMFLSSKRTPNEQLSGIKPGTFNFFCNTKGTNKVYGDVPVPVFPEETIIYLPIGWAESKDFYDDYSDSTGNTFINCEQIDKAGNDYLQRIDSTAADGTSIVLISSYTSDVFDTGVATDDYYIYLNALIFAFGGGSHWNEVLLHTSTWESVDVKTKTWNDIFGISKAPKVNITIYYQETLGDWSSASSIRNAEILSAIVNARYFKVKIEIEDPIPETYAQVENFNLKLYTKI